MRARACERLARRPLTGYWFRALRLKHWAGRLSSDHSRTSRSRFSAASPSNPLFRILYLGETHQVAVHEVGALLGDPNAPVANPRGSWAILSLRVVLDQVVDLTDSSQQRIIRTNHSELTGNWSITLASPRPNIWERRFTTFQASWDSSLVPRKFPRIASPFFQTNSRRAAQSLSITNYREEENK